MEAIEDGSLLHRFHRGLIMDRTTLTLAVDSSQVGTAAAAFDRFVNAGNAAANSAGRVTAASIAEGRAISQVLVPALNNGINRARNLAETQQALGQDATRQVAQQAAAVRAPAGYASTPALTPQSATTGRAVPTMAPTLSASGNASLGQLAGGASTAQGAIDRLTTAARNNRSALAQLTPAATAAAGSYRQLSATPIRLDAQQGLSAASAALANVAAQAEGARRSIAGLNRLNVPAPAQPLMAQIAARQSPASTSAASVAANAPNGSAMNALAAATARSTAATTAFAAAQGRAAEAAQHLAEANARNEAAQARLATAIQRAAAAQAAFDNASRTPGNADTVAQAQTRLQSAQAAVSVATANVARSHRAAADAAERHRIALQSVGRQSQLTSFQTQQLHFQLHDFFVQVASGGSPLTAFIQQGSQLSGTFGGAGGAFRAVTSLLTPTVLAFGAGAVAAGGYALALGHVESAARDLNAVQAQLEATGRKGLFSDAELRQYLLKLNELPGVTRDTATAIVGELSKVHGISGNLFKDLAGISVDYAKATGKDAAEAARELAKAFADPRHGAEQLDAVLDNLTSTQLLQIEQMRRMGDTAGVQKIMFEALEGSVKGLAERGMTPLQKAINELGNSWNRTKQSFNATESLNKTNAALAEVVGWAKYLVDHSDAIGNAFARLTPGGQAGVIATMFSGQAGNTPPAGKREVSGKITPAPNAVVAATTAPAANGKSKKEIDDEIKASLEAAKSYQSQAGKIEDLTDTRKRFNNALAQSISLYGKDSEQAKTLRSAVAGVDEKIAEARKKGGSEASQVLRAHLQDDLKSINDVFEKQRDAYQFQNAFVEAAYRNGNTSLVALMEQRQAAIENTAQAQIDELDKEKARLQEYLKQEKDPSTRVQTQTRIKEIDVEREKVETRKSNDIELLNQEKTASFKSLTEQVTAYRANLMQMQGDEAGAAALRAQLAIENAKILATQSARTPGVEKVDVDGLARAIAITDRYNEVQRQTSLLASNSARAEEAFILAAEQSGKSLMETERGLYELRSKELEQLGDLVRKAQELAEASKAPALKAFAAEIALTYAKAANAIDPALNRLRQANRELAAGLAQTVGNAPNAFVEFYSQRRSQSEQDIKAQKDEYDRRIDQLRGYLAQEKDVRNKATLQKRIGQLEGERDGLKVESKGKTAIDAIRKTVLEPAAQQVSGALSKVLIQDPMQEYFKNQLTSLTEGNGALAGVFKDALGIKANPQQQALVQQVAALDASTKAVDAFRVAAENAAAALNRPLVGPQASQGQGALADSADRSGMVDATQPPPIDSSLEGAPSEASKALASFGQQTTVTAADVVKLATAAGAGGDAMIRLPGIVGLFQSAVMALTANSSAGSGGIGGFIAKLFGGGGSVASSADYAASDWLAAAEGGYITGPGTGTSDSIPARLSNGEFVMPAAQTKQFRPVLEQMRAGSVFAGAPRYHTGGIVGQKPDSAAKAFAKAAEIKAGEVPAILMRNEEVLRRDDPRHRDNLGMSIVARIMNEAKPSESPIAKAAKDSAVHHTTVSTLLQTIAGGKGGGESSASVLAGVLDRLGVKDGEESAAANVLRVRGARELGGPVSAGGMYRVNERGPELLEVAGKQYLMMGSQGGAVDQKGGGTDRQPRQTIVNVSVTPPAGGSRASAAQWGTDAGRHIQRSLKRNG